MNLSAEFCIVGAGATGLTLAYELLKAGRKVILIEKSDRIGGLAKSFTYQDGHVFDIGPKRFHSNDHEVLNFINEIAQNDLLRIGRHSALHYQDRIIDWPLCPSTLLNLPLNVCFKTLYEQIVHPYRGPVNNFEDFVQKRYGKTLAESFFRPYTEKFLKIPAAHTHQDWAQLGINRTVIDREVNSIISVVKDLVPFMRKKDENFYYPTHGGFGSFFEKILTVISTNPNFQLILNQSVSRIHPGNSHYELAIQTDHGQELHAKKLVWTGNLNRLEAAIHENPVNKGLSYLNTYLFNIVIKQEHVLIKRKGIQWLYISSGDRLISRVSFPREFSSGGQKENYYNLTIEVTSRNEKMSKEKISELKNKVLQELVDLRLIQSTNCCEAIFFELVPDSYPIYDLNYKNNFANYFKSATSFSQSIILSGRTGAFWYNNSDHSIKMALALSKRLLHSQENYYIDKETIFS